MTDADRCVMSFSCFWRGLKQESQLVWFERFWGVCEKEILVGIRCVCQNQILKQQQFVNCVPENQCLKSEVLRVIGSRYTTLLPYLIRCLSLEPMQEKCKMKVPCQDVHSFLQFFCSKHLSFQTSIVVSV